MLRLVRRTLQPALPLLLAGAGLALLMVLLSQQLTLAQTSSPQPFSSPLLLPPLAVTDTLHIAYVIHAEENVTSDIPDYSDPVIFAHYDRVLRRLALVFAAHRAKFSLQPDWTFSWAAARYDPQLYPYLESLGHDIDPHAHETTYNYLQVKDFIAQAGGHPTPVLGGVAGVGITDTTYLWPIGCGSPSYTGTCKNYWVHYGWLTEPTTVTNFVEYAALPEIAAEFSVACTYARLWDHRNDDTPRTWRPSNFDQTGDWHIPDPHTDLVFVGRGPRYITEALPMISSAELNSWHAFASLRYFKAGPADGLPPAWTALPGEPDHWETQIAAIDTWLANTVDPLVSVGLVRWGTVDEIAIRYREWEASALFDRTPPLITPTHPAPGSTVNTDRPIIAAYYADPSGIDEATLRLLVDGLDRTAQAVYNDQRVYYPSSPLSPGVHTAILTVRDTRANLRAITWTFTVTANYTDVLLPSDSTGGGYLALRVFTPPPGAARYPTGAPVVISLPGADSSGSLENPFGGYLDDVIVVSFLFPGGCDDGRCSDGTYDHRGPDSIAALRDVILYASGLLTDSLGHTLGDVTAVPPHYDNVGLLAESNGGNIAVAMIAQYGSLFTDHLRWLVGWENPSNSQLVTVDLGPVKLSCPVGQNFQDNSVNPRYSAYGPVTLVVTYTDIAYDPTNPQQLIFLDGNGDGQYTLRTLPNGCRTPDLDGDGVVEADEDLPLAAYGGEGGKRYYSLQATQAMSQAGIFGGSWPITIATVAEADAYWSLRDAARNYVTATAQLPSLRVLLLFSQRDHVQSAPDKPHIHQAWDGFHGGGLWVRLNPGPEYITELDPSLVGAALPDNPPGLAPADWTTIADYAYPEGIPDALYQAAAVHEMADRTEKEHWFVLYLPLIIKARP